MTVEIKTVNHRYLDFFIRVPRGFMSFEDVVRQEVSQRLHRGRAEIVVTVEDFADTNRTVTIDWGLVKGYEAALKELEKTLGIHYQARGEHILQQPDVLIPESVAPEDVEPTLREAMHRALDNLLAMRAREGEALAQDILQRVAKLEALTQQLREQAPKVVASYHQKLKERVAELVQQVPVDEERLALEVAIFADKTNVTEELVRLDSHLNQFRTILQQEGPIGRKLDFLIQEIQRRLNTTASKANDSTASQLVVEGRRNWRKSVNKSRI